MTTRLSLEWVTIQELVSALWIVDTVLKNPKSGETEPPGHAHGTTNEISIFGLDSNIIYEYIQYLLYKKSPKKVKPISEFPSRQDFVICSPHLPKSLCNNIGEKIG